MNSHRLQVFRHKKPSEVHKNVKLFIIECYKFVLSIFYQDGCCFQTFQTASEMFTRNNRPIIVETFCPKVILVSAGVNIV